MCTSFRLLLLSAGTGFGAALAFVAGLLTADPTGLGAAFAETRHGMMPLVVIWLVTGLAFAGAQFGVALRLRGPGAPPRPIPIAVRARRTNGP